MLIGRPPLLDLVEVAPGAKTRSMLNSSMIAFGAFEFEALTASNATHPALEARNADTDIR
jgi:hypothetical protein